ncbi:coiled-coil domain-containing protein [Bifidobacterium pseudocatenulatum]|uniref:hypothetical protein n=1 Tax=Bifidobacterium pseudocatenulatum TaxID=28026 RepID=UPI001CFCDDCC|nr:hypothetical protein [Bifidobacterium pseudocatenulatum]MCB4912593.1 hypothetical protein [Bifidobacterium pseudocatenulatum]
MERPAFSAGEVGIDVVPLTDRFFAELRAKLHDLRDLKVPVEFDPDDMAASRTYEKWNGRDARVNVSYDVDMSGLRELSKQDERLRKRYEKPVKPVFDGSGVVKGLDTAIGRVEQLRKVQKNVGDVFTKNLGVFGKTETSRLKEQMLLLDQSEERMRRIRADRDELVSMRGDEWNQLNRQILGNMSTLDALQKRYDELGSEISKVTAYRDSLRGGGRRDEAKAQTVRLRELRAEYRATARNMREVTNETNRLAKQQDKLKSDSVAKWIHDLDKQLVELDSHTKSVRKTFDSVARSGFFKSSDMGKTNVLSGVSFFGKDLNRQLNTERAARREQERLNDSWRDGAEWQGNLLEGTARYARNLKTASNVMNAYGKDVKEANRLLDEQEQRLTGLQRALRGVNKYGRYSEVNKQLNDQLAAVNRLRKQIESNPIKTRLVLDDSRFNRKYANITHQVGELTKKLERENELKIRVDFWTDTADSLEERLRRLQHGRIQIPADIVVDNKNLIERARQVAEEVRRNPDRKVELEADLDLDMKRAEERIKDFQKANDTFNMDVDLETAAARAHLAYFTRPRTVDIFAEFKGTDLGKIMSGMTAGATGVRGVQNEWQKLVNMFDKFDEVVPKWSLLGAVFASVGAGALNLSRTAGSAGASLVMMSKAALAAPGALLGLSAGYEVAYAAANKFGAYVDVSTTKLGGLHDKLADTFWKQAANPVTDMMNALGDSKYVENMNGVADAEGRIVAQEPYVDRINSILGNTVKGVDALDPGVQAVTTSVVRLGDRTSSYLPRMANYVSRNATLMAQWVDEAERTGKVTQAMEKAIEQGGYLMSSVKSAGGILKGTFGTLAEGENGIEKFSDALSRADRAVNGVKFQTTLIAWADGAKQASGKFHDSFREIGDAAYELRDTTKQAFVDAGSMVSTGIGSVSSMLGKSKTGIADFSNGVSEGFQKVFRAVDSASPMFDSLLSMSGELSDTFGGTLGNTLKSAAPTIKVLADGASTMAQAFGKLPAPVQAMVGMYATFGKAGISAYNSLKRGMLQNIESTLQYRKTLSQLGITSQETAISMSELVRAMARLKSGQTAGVLTGEVSNIRQMGAAADETTAKLNRMNRAQAGGSAVAGVAAGAGSTGLVRGVGEAAEGAARKTGLLKTALSGVVDFLGGPVGIAIGGVTTALSLAGSAISSYNDAAAHTQSVNRTVADSFKNVQSGAADASTAVSKAKKTVSKNWADKDYGWTLPNGNAVEKLFSGVTKWVSPFKDSSKAADALGISVKQLNSAATGTNDAYDKMHKKLEAIKNDQQWVMGANGQMVNANEQQAEAAERLLGVLEDSHTEWVKGMKVASDWIGSADSVANVSALAADKLSLLSESLAANNYELEGSSKNAQTNRKMMADYANSALLAAKNIIYAGNGSAEANQKAKNAVYSARQEIIQMAEQCGMSAEAAAALADQMGLIPDNVSTKFDLTNMNSVKAQVQDYIDQLELTKGQKEIILDLVQQGDITSFDQLAGAVKALMGGASKKDLFILLDAQDNASGKIKNATALAKGFGLTKAEINILATDEAGPKLDAVKQKLRDSGLTDAQIQILIDALDKTQSGVDSAKNNLHTIEQTPVDVPITAADNTQGGVASAQFSVNSVRQGAPTLIDAVDRASVIAQIAKGNIENVPRNWPTLFAGIGNTSAVAVDAKNQIVSVPTWWGSRLDASTTGYDAVAGLAGQWNSIQSKSVTLDASVVARGIANAGHKATGGRISGPGTGTSDSIPMWLSNGEHVIMAASASKLDRTVGPNFLNVLNATGDLDRAVSQARTSYARSARDMSRNAYASGGRVQRMLDSATSITVSIPSRDDRELVSAVNDLRREVAGFRDGIGGEISRNSSPWPSKRDFVRDVLEASRGR